MYNLLKLNIRLALRIKIVKQSQVKGQCALNKFVERILVELFIYSKKKDFSEHSRNHTDAASR